MIVVYVLAMKAYREDSLSSGDFCHGHFGYTPPLQFSLLFDYPFSRRQYGLALARPVDETPSGAFGVFRPTASVVNKKNINFH